MPDVRPQIFAFSGVLKPKPNDRNSFTLIDHALKLAGTDGPAHLCYIPTAVGDSQQAIDFYIAAFAGRMDIEFSVLRLFTQPNVPDIRGHLLSQDVILVEGGSVVNLMAVWRAHGLPQVLRECWDAGVVLAGASAGSLCWHLGGPTDSFGDSLDVLLTVSGSFRIATVSMTTLMTSPGASITPSTWPRSPRSATPAATAAPAMTAS